MVHGCNPASSLKCCKKLMLNKCLKCLVSINPFTIMLRQPFLQIQMLQRVQAQTSVTSFILSGSWPYFFQEFSGPHSSEFQPWSEPLHWQKHPKLSVPTMKLFRTGLQLEDSWLFSMQIECAFFFLFSKHFSIRKGAKCCEYKEKPKLLP